jgi:hypothetical protein
MIGKYRGRKAPSDRDNGMYMRLQRQFKPRKRVTSNAFNKDQLGLSGIVYSVYQRELSLGEQVENARNRELWARMSDKQKAPLLRSKNKFNTQDRGAYMSTRPSSSHPYRNYVLSKREL